MNLSQSFQLASGIIMLIVPIIVISRILKGKINPNATSFFIRSIVAAANLSTYLSMTHHDMWKSTIISAATVSLVSIFIVCVCKNGIGRLTWVEKTSLALGLIILAFWYHTGKSTETNMLLQIIITLAYWPLIDSVRKRRNNEIGLPWALATTAYFLAFIGLLTSHSSVISMVNPIIGVITNAIATIVVILTNRKAQL